MFGVVQFVAVIALTLDHVIVSYKKKPWPKVLLHVCLVLADDEYVKSFSIFSSSQPDVEWNTKFVTADNDHETCGIHNSVTETGMQ